MRGLPDGSSRRVPGESLGEVPLHIPRCQLQEGVVDAPPLDVTTQNLHHQVQGMHQVAATWRDVGHRQKQQGIHCCHVFVVQRFREF